MFKVSLLAAFLGGFLTLLPSCGPFLLPAFFAYAFKEKEKILVSTLIFFLGFLASFLPLGIGITVLTSFVIRNTTVIYNIAGVLLLVFAAMALFGKSFFVTRAGPVASAEGPVQKDFFHLFLFGASFGLATFACTAPIFGAVLTVVAASGAGLPSLLLLFTFALGMIVPLILLAFFFDSSKKWQQRLFQCVFRFRLHGKLWAFPLTNIISAALFSLLGILFLTSQAASPFVVLGTKLGILDFFFVANQRVLTWTAGLPTWVNIGFLVILAAFVGLVAFRLRRAR